MTPKQTKVNYALKLLSNLGKMKKGKVACDFEIRVKGKCFSVHRSVLIASCPYFENLFSSNMREVQEGLITMKEVEVEGIESTLEFIYTGELNVTSSNMQCILETSHLLQLDDLVKICLQYLKDNLSPETSLLAVSLFALYGSDEDQVFADEYVVQHFEEVVRTKMFPLINKYNLTRYLQAASLELSIHWKAITTWMERNQDEQFLAESVENLLKSQKPTLTFLTDAIWKHPLVENNKRMKEIVIGALSHKKDVLSKEINLGICFNIKSMLRTNDLAEKDAFHDVLNSHLASNFGQAIKEDAFSDLSPQDVKGIFESNNLRCGVESSKWEALLKWVKHDKSREKCLPDLMKLINYEKIPLEYMQRNMRNEPLVKKSGKCKDILLDALLAGSSSVTDKPTFYQSTLVMLEVRSAVNVLTALNVENGNHTRITTIEKRNFARITSVKGELYLLRDKNLSKYTNSGTWIEKAPPVKLPGLWTQIVSFRNRIYVVDRSYLLSYDPSENIWKEESPGCGLSRGFCVTSSDESIYAFGGFDSLRDGRRFDTKSGSWFETAPMQTERADGAAACYCNRIYVMGGEVPNSVECYDRSSNTWAFVEYMNIPRSCFTAVVYNNKLYVVGGDCSGNRRRLASSSIEVFDQDSKKWEIAHKTPKFTGMPIDLCCVLSSNVCLY